MRFYDRKEEIDLLHKSELQSTSQATFTVLTGRRRVGKTSLVRKALEGKEYAYLFVTRDSEPMLCARFKQVLEQELGVHIYGTPTHFRELFEAIMLESIDRHFSVVIDEFQTLYYINPAIFGEIQDLWDRYHTQSKLNLIVSGSIQTLMNRIFGEKHEPLYGRPTSRFTLLPFRISVLKEILADYHPAYSKEDLLCLYMLTGGVAKYVELLMDAQCVTKEKMLNYVCRRDSYFLTEGRNLISQEFRDESVTYFSILQAIASGLNRRNEIEGALHKDVGVYLQNLEQTYQIVSRTRPILSKPNSKISSYEIRDHFLRFWFRFIHPYQSLIEQQRLDLLRSYIGEQYNQFSGRTLERYFQRLMMEEGLFTQVGNWWDRSGENEIDLVAVNEFNHTGVVAEIKRDPKRISLQVLEQKVATLPPSDFAKYHLELKGLSLRDM